MRFAYKINSSYDGFNPGAIPKRLRAGRLVLGWKRYIESVERDSEVWVHFRGPDAYIDGVYIFGTVTKVDLARRKVTIAVDEFSTDEPLTEPAVSEAVARVVDTRYAQVFVLPADLLRVFPCDINSSAESCKARRCGQCDAWRGLPAVSKRALMLPPRLREAEIAGFAPAYWAVAKRSWGWNHKLRPGIGLTDSVFNRFKGGEDALAYPLARGIAAALRKRGLEQADCLIPIPLSPEKAARNELHRTLALANELSQLLGIDVRESLKLDRPISKRALGLSAEAFERRYAQALSCRGIQPKPTRVIVVDDVCTKGSTLAVAIAEIHQRYPDCEVVAATAAQMTIVEAIAETAGLLKKS